ncbi:DoxX family membrane protein [Kocuria rhizosphaericola]|uniref:DoxX family membrane protein n=1 Tax=Kocuria rhizosphaericola TaxID=3376284 RepID=UPI0037AE2AB2
MHEGILILRILLGLILLVHAAQKSLGWFQGSGPTVMAGAFESMGLRPGRPMVFMASITEALAAISLLLGLLTPLGAAAAAGTMTVAGATSQLSAGSFWNARKGGEYPYVLAVAALVLAFTGAGAWSVDAWLGGVSPALAPFLGGTGVGAASFLLATVSALLFLWVVLRRSPATRSG